MPKAEAGSLGWGGVGGQDRQSSVQRKTFFQAEPSCDERSHHRIKCYSVQVHAVDLS